MSDKTETGGAERVRAAVPVMHLCLALNGARLEDGPAAWPLAGYRRVILGRGARSRAEPEQRGAAWDLRVELADSQISREHGVLERRDGRWHFADGGSRNGSWLDGRRCAVGEPVALSHGATLQLGRTLLVARELPAGQEWTSAPGDSPLDTMSPALAKRLAALSRIVAAGDGPILLRGPTGSGKELVARAIHALLGHRGRTGRLVAVNSGALPHTLVEAELFGVRRGAYSGADADRPGLVRAAQGGTLFLDEIGDLEPASQAALLRVLQEREVVPVGSTEPIAVDVVFVAATHRDLAAMRAQGSFREDLYARLAGFELHLPPLSERIEDLGLLMRRLLAARKVAPPALDAAAVRAIAGYRWPRNVRELGAVLASACALARDGVLRLEHLPATLREGRVAASAAGVESAPSFAPDAKPAEPGVRSARDARIRARLLELLAEHHGNVAAVARDMGKHRRQIHRWIERFEIDRERYRPPF